MVESLQSTTSLMSRILGWLKQKNSEDRRAIVYFYLVDNIAQWMHLVYSAPSHDLQWANDQLDDLKEEIVKKCLENKNLMNTLNKLNKSSDEASQNTSVQPISIKTYPTHKRKSKNHVPKWVELSQGRSYSTSTVKYRTDKRKGKDSQINSGIKSDAMLAGKESPLLREIYTPSNYTRSKSLQGSSDQLTSPPQKSSIISKEVLSTDQPPQLTSLPQKLPVKSKGSSRRKTVPRLSRTVPTESYRTPTLPGRRKSSRTPLPQNSTKSSETPSLPDPTPTKSSKSPSLLGPTKTFKTPSAPTKSKRLSLTGPMSSKRSSLPSLIKPSKTPLLTGQMKSFRSPSLAVDSSSTLSLSDPTKSSSISSLPIAIKFPGPPLRQIKSARTPSLPGPIKSSKTPSLTDPMKSLKALRIKSPMSNSLPCPIQSTRTPSISGPIKPSRTHSLPGPTKSTKLPSSKTPSGIPSLPESTVSSRSPSPTTPSVSYGTPLPTYPRKRASSLPGPSNSAPNFTRSNKRNTQSEIPHDKKYTPILKLAHGRLDHLTKSKRTDSGTKTNKHVTILLASSRPVNKSKRIESKKAWY